MSENTRFKATIISRDQAKSIRTGYIVTLNMQHLYQSLRDPLLRLACFEDPLARLTIDGKGAAILLKRYLGVTLELYPGNEMVRDLLSTAQGGKFLVVGTTNSVIEQIQIIFPSLHFDHCGDNIPLGSDEALTVKARAIREQFPDAFKGVFLALGVPKQERMARYVARKFECPVYCIGGSFEILSEQFPRAPPLIRRLGLEGVWRLIKEPNAARLSRLSQSYAYFALFALSRSWFYRAIRGGGKL